MPEKNIESGLNERLFAPPAGFAARCPHQNQAEYETLYKGSLDSPEHLLAAHGRGTPLVQEVGPGAGVEPPFAKWFVGGKINIAYNCLDRH